MTKKDEEEPQVYYIPGNYDEGGGVAGGRIKTRNFVELVVLCVPVAFLEYKFLPFSLQTNLIIFLVTIIPLAALCIFGINSESLSQILMDVFQFFTSVKHYSYTMFSRREKTEKKGFSLDRFLDSISTNGVKKTMDNMRKENALKTKEAQKQAAAQTGGRPKKKTRRGLFGKKMTDQEEQDELLREDLRRQEEALGSQSREWKERASEDKSHTDFNRGKT